MIAAVRFRLSGHLRSGRVLHPVLALALLLAIVFSSPLGGTPEEVRRGVLTAFGDLAALVFPICAWAARGLLDTEPDVQRHLCAVTAGRWRSIIAGLVAAYCCGAGLALLALVYPLIETARYGLRPSVVLLTVALMLVSALAATMLGALTSRAVIPSSAASILVLLGACAADLLLSLGPLRVLTVPMIEWMRAAGDGAPAFARAVPVLALRALVWSAVVGACYLRLRRRRA